MRLRIITHPPRFRDATRVLMLKGRHKDGIEQERTVTRVTHGPVHFALTLAELCRMARPGERIYGSAAPRDVPKAVREFKRRQLDADYDADPLRFYRGIDAQWVAALMQPTSEADKRWLFDCDTPEHTKLVETELALHYDRPVAPYWYDTKSGRHVVVAPFDRTKLSPAVALTIHQNPLMLWVYWK